MDCHDSRWVSSSNHLKRPSILILPYGKLWNIPLDIRPLVNKITMTSRVKPGTVRKVEEVNKRELIPCKIPLFTQNLFLNIEICTEGGDILRNHHLVGW